MTAANASPTREQQVALYERMLLIRGTEELLRMEAAAGQERAKTGHDEQDEQDGQDSV